MVRKLLYVVSLTSCLAWAFHSFSPLSALLWLFWSTELDQLQCVMDVWQYIVWGPRGAAVGLPLWG